MTRIGVVRPSDNGPEKLYLGEDIIFFTDSEEGVPNQAVLEAEDIALYEGGCSPGCLPITMIDTVEAVAWAVKHGFLDAHPYDRNLSSEERGEESKWARRKQPVDAEKPLRLDLIHSADDSDNGGDAAQ
jgi:hypothetical protein